VLQGQVEMAAWNVWQRRAGGFTFVDARSVGTSGAATVPQVNMPQSISHQRVIMWLPASNRVKIGSLITKRSG